MEKEATPGKKDKTIGKGERPGTQAKSGMAILNL